MNLARQQDSTASRERALAPNDPMSTWESHRLANRAAMVSLLAALLAVIGATTLAAAVVHSGPTNVLTAAALLALAAATFAVLWARSLRGGLDPAGDNPQGLTTHEPDHPGRSNT